MDNIYAMAREDLGMDVPVRTANIDGDIICYSIAFACQKKDKPMESEQFCLATVKSFIHNTVEAVAADEYRIFLTGENNFRIKLAVSKPYKGNRKQEKPKYYQLIRDYLVEHHHAEIVNDIEADDALGLAQTEHTILCTIDKDLDMIEGQHYNWNKKKYYRVSQDDADKFFMIQWLTGDSTDNIGGAYKIGKVKAEKALAGMTDIGEMYFTVGDIYAKCGHSQEYMNEQGHLIWMQRKEAITFMDFLDEGIPF